MIVDKEKVLDRGSDDQISLLEQSIHDSVLKMVTKHISDMVQPEVDKMVKQLAGEAVKDWSFNYKAMQPPEHFGMKTNISIKFVENIIRTEYKENDISIEVVENE